MIAEYRGIFPIIDRNARMADMKREALSRAWEELGRLGLIATGTPSTVHIDHENARVIVNIQVQWKVQPVSEVWA